MLFFQNFWSDLRHVNFSNYSVIYAMWILIFVQDTLTTHKNYLEKEFPLLTE